MAPFLLALPTLAKRLREEACALEEAILHEIAATIQEHQRLADPRIPACIIDLDQVAADNLGDLRGDPPMPPASGKFPVEQVCYVHWFARVEQEADAR